MTILLAVLTVACVSWIITKEVIFEDLRTWSERYRWLYPLRCPYCLAPWVTLLVCVAQRIPLIYVFPVIWLAYLNLTLYQRLRQQL